MEQVSTANDTLLHNEWKEALSFHKQELQTFRNDLLEVASRTHHPDIMRMVEHFQNQFLIQTENIDILRHNIKYNAKSITGTLPTRSILFSTDENHSYDELKEKFEDFSKVFTELKDEFIQFLHDVR